MAFEWSPVQLWPLLAFNLLAVHAHPADDEGHPSRFPRLAERSPTTLLFPFLLGAVIVLLLVLFTVLTIKGGNVNERTTTSCRPAHYTPAAGSAVGMSTFRDDSPSHTRRTALDHSPYSALVAEAIGSCSVPHPLASSDVPSAYCVSPPISASAPDVASLSRLDSAEDKQTAVFFATVRTAWAYRAALGREARQNFIVCDPRDAMKDSVCFLLVENRAASSTATPVTVQGGQDALIADIIADHHNMHRFGIPRMVTVIDRVTGQPGGMFVHHIPAEGIIYGTRRGADTANTASRQSTSSTRCHRTSTLQRLSSSSASSASSSSSSAGGDFRQRSETLSHLPSVQEEDAPCLARPPSAPPAVRHRASSMRDTTPKTEPGAKIACGATCSRDSSRCSTMAPPSSIGGNTVASILSPRRTYASPSQIPDDPQMEQAYVIAQRIACAVLVVNGSGSIDVVIGTGDGCQCRHFLLEDEW
eukprot:GEMP01015445.1.p1 GENE.GEMP01015445.1~~GEMP01015445.1.p1  ORF type:complete len:474 (+),score=147.75 GEMP01015445.1:117-1538(+)